MARPSLVAIAAAAVAVVLALSASLSLAPLSTRAQTAAAGASASSVCATTLQTTLLPGTSFTNAKVLRNNGNGRLQVFWKQVEGGVNHLLWTSFVDAANVTGASLSTPVLVSNSTLVLNDFRVAVSSSERLMVVVMNRRITGLSYRYSTDAGATWLAKDIDGSAKAIDGTTVANVASSAQSSFDLIWSGSEFVLTGYSTSPTTNRAPAVAYLNSTFQWTTWGLDPAAGTYNGQPYTPSDTDPEDAKNWNGVQVTSTPVRTDAGNPGKLVIASDGSTILVGYELTDGRVEFQSQSTGSTKSIFTKLANTTYAAPRTALELASNGVRGTFILVSSVAPVSPLYNNLVSEISTNGGRTWSTARVIGLGLPVGSVANFVSFSVHWLNEWQVFFQDGTTGVGLEGVDVVFSSSPTGLVWSSPDVVIDAGTNAVADVNTMRWSASQYVGAFSAETGVGVFSCPISTVENYNPSAAAPGARAAIASAIAVVAVALAVVGV